MQLAAGQMRDAIEFLITTTAPSQAGSSAEGDGIEVGLNPYRRKGYLLDLASLTSRHRLQAMYLWDRARQYDAVGGMYQAMSAVLQRQGFLRLGRGLSKLGAGGLVPYLCSTLLLDPRVLAVTVPLQVSVLVAGMGPGKAQHYRHSVSGRPV